jgi:enoyl-CoA hydratase
MILAHVTEEIVTEEHENIAILTVNRPRARNALNWSAQRKFHEVVTHYASNSKIRSLIITGSGSKAFVSGGDIKELVVSETENDGKRLQQVMGAALDILSTSPFPVIAAINGDAVGGGCELLTACDIRIAVSNARFRFAQLSLGLTTGWGGTGRLVRLIGQSRASDWLLTGRNVEAAEAQECGFVNYLVPDGSSLMAHALDIAYTLAKLPTAAVASTKSLLKVATTQPLDQVGEVEKRLFMDLWLTEERLQLMRSVTEKRK